MESSVDVYYTRDLFHFRWDWKADRISVAEPKRMESKKMLTQMPLDPRDWPKWLKQDLSHETAEIQLSAKNDKKVIDPYSLHSIYLMGMGWKTEVELWPKPDWKKFAFDDLVVNSRLADSDLEYLKNEWSKHYFKNYDLHCATQRANFWDCCVSRFKEIRR